MDQNRKFAEMNGLCWHKWIRNDGPFTRVEYRCMYCAQGADYPQNMEDGMDFSDPREVLKVVTEKDNFIPFLESIGGVAGIFLGEKHISLTYITTPGKLRDAWIEWKEKQT
jgi:hypothetical protein